MFSKKINRRISIEDYSPVDHIPVLVDVDRAMKYETHHVLRWLLEPIHLPLLNGLSPAYGKLAKAMSPDAKKLVETAGSFNAIEVIHNYHGFKTRTPSAGAILQALGEFHWQHTATAKGVRNRRKMVKKIVKNLLNSSARKKNHIVVLGASFSRPQIEALSEYRGTTKVGITIIDKNDGPLKFAKDLSKELGVEDKITFAKDTPWNFASQITPDTILVESIGIADYFNTEKTIELARRVQEALPEHGCYLTGNIRPNPEYRFVTHGGKWVMDYKYEEELAHIMIKAGFDARDIMIMYEPCKVFGLIMTKRDEALVKNYNRPYRIMRDVKKSATERTRDFDSVREKHLIYK